MSVLSPHDDFRIIRASWLDVKLQHLGLNADRLMWWCNTDPPNFGDMIGPLIFKERRGVQPKLAPLYMRPNRAPVHLAAGSILDVCRVADLAMVWGSGIMWGTTNFAAPREIHAVRGPLTAARCRDQGYACPDVYGDPGIVLPHLLETRSGSEHALGIVPHYVDREAARLQFPERDGVRIIDVTLPVEEVVAEIQLCEVLVSSSLHGVIVSHAFGRRCAWVEFGDSVAGDGTKFADYYGAAGITDVAARRIAPETSVDDLAEWARAAPLPDVSRLADQLLDCCPY
jgi:pyruvyltransferase